MLGAPEARFSQVVARVRGGAEVCGSCNPGRPSRAGAYGVRFVRFGPALPRPAPVGTTSRARAGAFCQGQKVGWRSPADVLEVVVIERRVVVRRSPLGAIRAAVGERDRASRRLAPGASEAAWRRPRAQT